MGPCQTRGVVTMHTNIAIIHLTDPFHSPVTCGANLYNLPSPHAIYSTSQEYRPSAVGATKGKRWPWCFFYDARWASVNKEFHDKHYKTKCTKYINGFRISGFTGSKKVLKTTFLMLRKAKRSITAAAVDGDVGWWCVRLLWRTASYRWIEDSL